MRQSRDLASAEGTIVYPHIRDIADESGGDSVGIVHPPVNADTRFAPGGRHNAIGGSNDVIIQVRSKQALGINDGVPVKWIEGDQAAILWRLRRAEIIVPVVSAGFHGKSTSLHYCDDAPAVVEG